MKKNILLLAAGLLFLAACASKPKMEVTVKNPIKLERVNETVEIAWGEVIRRFENATPDNVIVLNAAGKQIPSQVVYHGEPTPQLLIFQATVAPNGKSTYRITTGVRESFPVQAYGRYVPERFDDYAWENNLVVYRLYGPALETTPGQMLVTPGIDVWVKSTEKMVIDEWYKRGDYHRNHGEGMDAYKVGKTLGAGASAPFIDGKLWLSRNYAAYETLDNGPIRTAVRLTYAPFPAGSETVSLVKTIELDANTRFSKMTDVYSGSFESIPVAAALVMHDVKGKFANGSAMGLTEAVSDSKQPEVDGDISLAIIMKAASENVEAEGHFFSVADVRNNQPMVYYAGSAWSQAGVPDVVAWESIVNDEALKVLNKLEVTISLN